MTLDVIGNIAIMHFPDKIKKKDKIKQAKKVLKKKKSVKTVLEKSENVKGRLRTIKTTHLAGEKTKEALYNENSCKFRLNVETCYFSPRLAEERKQVAEKIKNLKKPKKPKKVLVLFSGVAPFPVVIAKTAKPKEIVAIELSRQCNKYAKENVKLNKQTTRIELIQGDVKKVIPRLSRKKQKYDVIVMPRPNLKETFLKQAFKVSKKDTRIFYYCFGRDEDLNKELEEIYKQSKTSKKKIKIQKIKKAGDIAPFKWRWRIDFIVKN